MEGTERSAATEEVREISITVEEEAAGTAVEEEEGEEGETIAAEVGTIHEEEVVEEAATIHEVDPLPRLPSTTVQVEEEEGWACHTEAEGCVPGEDLATNLILPTLPSRRLLPRGDRPPLLRTVGLPPVRWTPWVCRERGRGRAGGETRRLTWGGCQRLLWEASLEKTWKAMLVRFSCCSLFRKGILIRTHSSPTPT